MTDDTIFRGVALNKPTRDRLDDIVGVLRLYGYKECALVVARIVAEWDASEADEFVDALAKDAA